MFRKLLSLFCVLFLRLGTAQDLTPVASYEFKEDSIYQKQLNLLINSYEQTQEILILDSIAQLSFGYKDWETSMDYAKQAVDLQPNAQRYFLLGGAAGFRALEVPMLSSLRYVNIMKPAFEKAVALEPDNVAYLRAQVDVLVALPSLLGGSVEEALQLIQKIKKQDLYEGLLAEGSLYEKKIENRDRAKEIYDQLFLKLNQEYKSCSEAFIEVLKNRRRNFSYDLARISADFGLENEWGLCALSYFESSYLFRDTVPLAWVYYYQHIFAKKTGKEESAEIYFNKLENYKEVFPELLKKVNNTKL